MAGMGSTPGSRRRRQHEATVEEIKTVARVLMAREGTSSVNLRAVAREMGMTASALYRYFPSREAILTALVTEAYDAVGDAVEQAVAAAPQDRTASAMMAGVHAFRRWALEHPQEYGLIFGTPVPGYEAPEEQTLGPALRTTFVLLGELIRALRNDLVTPPADDRMPADVRAALVALATSEHKAGFRLPPAVWALALQFWAVLLGAITVEVFGHLPRSLASDAGSFFDFTMRRALAVMGVHQPAIDAAVSPPF
jgi:AcrR family transcriptional regulator